MMKKKKSYERPSVLANGGMPRWSDKELDILIKMYPDHSNEYIAATSLKKRSAKGILSQGIRMNLKKSLGRLQEMGHENVALREDRRSA